MKPGLKRVSHYSQEQRDLSIKVESPVPKPPKTPKAPKVRQSSRRTKKQQEVDPNVAVLVLLVIVGVVLFLIGSMR